MKTTILATLVALATLFGALTSLSGAHADTSTDQNSVFDTTGI